MECSTVADRIAAYLDGELARSEREMFEVHLESCEGCQALVERVDAIDMRPPPTLPETAEPRFWATMDSSLSAELDAAVARSAEVARGPPVSAPPTPPWWRRAMAWELRVSFPVVAGYAALLALALVWSWSNLQRAQSAEYATQNLAEQLEREQRQQQPQRPVPSQATRTASSPYRIKF